MKPRKISSTATLVLSMALAFLAGDRILGWSAAWIVRASHFRYSEVFKGGINADVLVLGNSRGVNAVYVPAAQQATGCKIFNLSFNGSPTVLNEILLHEYLKRNRAPSLVVLEITDLFSDQGLTLNMKPYVGLSDGIAHLLETASPAVAHAANLSLLFRYNSELFMRALYYFNRSDQDWRYNGEISSAGVARALDVLDTMHGIEPANLAALKRMTALLAARRIGYRLLVSPYLPRFATALDQHIPWREAVMRKLGDHARLWDYEYLLRDNRDFVDPVHINWTGNETLMRHLLDDGFFAGCAGGAPAALRQAAD